MNIPKFWANGSSKPGGAGFTCWKWSDVSVDDARRLANARALELEQLFGTGQPLSSYGYSDRPLREEIVQTVGEAVVTRNAYGCLVLNAANVMFIDVDFAAEPAKAGQFFRKLFGQPAAMSPEDLAMQRVKTLAAERPELAIRVYRTAAGLRAVITNQTFDPADPAALDLLRHAGSDPLYVRLCQAQTCFRARLTPKPWRCGVKRPPARWPFASAAVEASFRHWQTDYERTSRGFSVCRQIATLGPATVDPAVQPILSLHDQFACAHADRPLA